MSMPTKTKEHTKVYIVNRLIGKDTDNEYLEAVGYTINDYILEIFISLLCEEDLEYYNIEEFPLEQLPQQLDLYDMDVGAHQFNLVVDKYDPNNITISTGAIEQGVLEDECNYSHLNNSAHAFFKVMKMMSLFRYKDEMDEIMERFRLYLILTKLSDLTSIEGISHILENANFPQHVIDYIELNGSDSLISQVKLYKNYIKTH